jgi:NarL family two-component system response regulator LiaR
MVETRPIRVVIVDDHDMLRRGLAIFLEIHDDLELVGEASSAKEAIELCQRVRPDVMLLDLIMPEMNGTVAIPIIREKCPETQIVALTSFNDSELVQAALQGGAISYLLKNVSLDELAKAIRDAHQGKSFLSQEVVQVLAARPVLPTLPQLTQRELQVLQCMAKGLSNQQIAIRLSIAPATIKKHVSAILSKLNANSRTEAVAMAIQNKMVQEDV